MKSIKIIQYSLALLYLTRVTGTASIKTLTAIFIYRIYGTPALLVYILSGKVEASEIKMTYGSLAPLQYGTLPLMIIIGIFKYTLDTSTQ